jgi:hypothetical protein
MKTTVPALKLNAHTHIEMAEEQLAEFALKFAKDPMNSFRWGEEALKAAATRSVWLEVLETLEEETVEDVRQLAIRHALRLAEPYRSSNELANLLHARECAAWANVASIIK